MKKAWVLFSTEMWEKFNFFGMRAILSLFMVHGLLFSEKDTAIYYGAFLALSYFTPMLGGMIADRYRNYRFSILLGAWCLAIAQLFLFFANFGWDLNLSRTLTFIGLFFVIVGNGFFKPNIAASLTQMYENQRTQLDAVFSNYYLYLNFGALLGQFIVPLLGDKVTGGVRDVAAFKWGFLAAFVAMLIGIVIYWLATRKNAQPLTAHIDTAQPSKREPIQIDKGRAAIAGVVGIVIFGLISWASGGEDSHWIQTLMYPVIYATGIGLALYLFLDKALTKLERRNLLTIFVSSAFIIFFWATYEQAGTSLTFIADNQTDRNFLGLELTPAMIGLFNPLFIMIIAVPFAWMWQKLGQANLEPSNLAKQAIGLLLMALSYLIIAYNVKDLGDSLLLVKWLVLLYFIQTCAEMFLSPIGLSLVGKLAPKRHLSLLFGIFYLANAAGYALSGVLAALIPPTTDKFQKAQALGIDLQSVLSNPTQVSTQVLQTLADNQLPTSYPTFMGWQITNLFEFFMMFAGISLVAAVLLMLINLCFKLESHPKTVEA